MTSLISGIARNDGLSSQVLPVGVVGDQAGLVVRDVLLDEAANRGAEGLQHLALLGDVHAFERVEIGRMDGEEAHELVHAFVHRAVERRELSAGARGSSACCLASFLSSRSDNDVGDILASDADLLEAVLHAPQGVGDELEARLSNRLSCTPAMKRKRVLSADLADLAQEVEVEDQLLLFAGAQVVEQLVDDEQQTCVG